MAERKPSYAQLTHDVVHVSPEPLTLDEIIDQVNALRPITTKNPRSTIRGAIGGQPPDHLHRRRSIRMDAAGD